ncbi:hypothetical protein BKA70DRAFT_1307306 [Coprinopsis sp. MPI-PUGE-AT-0042]|nr:hypothetical protein BKA70DRAFT_1307306 [Coprinopsis sp. MPI-PUGE-AT-0042]
MHCLFDRAGYKCKDRNPYSFDKLRNSAMPTTPNDAVIPLEYGRLKVEYVAAILYSALGSLQIYLSVHAFAQFRRLPEARRQQLRRYVYLSALILALSIARFVIYVSAASDNLMDSPGLLRMFDIVGSPIEAALSFGCTTVLALVGDAVLVWRATIIWSHDHRVRWIPIAVYLLYLGVCIISSVFKSLSFQGYPPLKSLEFMTGSDIEVLTQDQQLRRSTIQAWRITDFAMSVVVSVVTTTMICIRLLLMKKKIDRIGKGCSQLMSTLPYSRLITFLVESSLPFNVVGAIGAISMAGIGHESSLTWGLAFSTVMMVLWINCLALGPQVIIFRILSGTTWTSNPSTRTSPPLSQPIHFVHDDAIFKFNSFGSVDEQPQIESGWNEPPQLQPAKLRSELRYSV